MNISLPSSLKSFVDERIRNGGFSSHSEYVRDLVRKDEIEQAKTKLTALIAQGMASPPGRSWAEVKADMLARVSK